MWVPLHVHSQYSILDAAASVKDIAAKAAEFKMPAVALTDHGNLYGAVEFYKACTGVGVKPIIGCEVYVAPDSHLIKNKESGKKSAYHLTLLAKNAEGYRNLCKLSSIGFLEGFYYHPRIDFDLLREHAEGLICLSGCLSSPTSQEILHGSREKLFERIQWYQDVFGDDFYIELQRHQMKEEDIIRDGMRQETWLMQDYENYISNQTKVSQALIEIAKERNIPLVATNDSHYIDREDWHAHEILLNIQSGEPVEVWENDSRGIPKFRKPNPKRRTYSTHECYFKSPEQMAELFQDVPEAISNTLKVAEKCQLKLDFVTKHYPVFHPPTTEGKQVTVEERNKAVEAFLWQLCEEGIPKRYTPERLAHVQEVYPGQDPMAIVRARLQRELDIIVPKGMADYLLIVWDFINWAKVNGIPMGPGRGSGAGSIVLYLIGVTDIEPLRFNLFFERFINPERISYPDIDVDICMERRGDVINYTLNKYGKDSVAQIITFGTMKAKMTIKDVGRVLNIPLSKVNEIAKLVPDDLTITLDKALEVDPDLRKMYEQDEDAERIMNIGRRLEGSIRNSGIHAAGLIVAGEPLTEFIPVCSAKDSEMPVTQYSMKPVESVGMLKIDFLGLKTLTAIQKAVDAIYKRTGKSIDWVNLPLDDKPTFDLLNQGKTLGVFQLESGGMQDLARQLHLDKFEEIIAVGALYRPGPMDMIPSFIARKHGREPIEYDHPSMKDILAETYGIMVYQEQVMEIASRLAGYTLGEGDVLRRAMGKKDKEQMAQEREKFRSGSVSKGVDEHVAISIFDKIEKFAAYGFNKSHAAAYGYLSYVTGYLKANYPGEWMAALMTCDQHDLTKVTKFIREAQALGIPMLPPDVNESGIDFVATTQGIRFALSAIRGVGSGVVEAIIQEREKRGPYTSLYNFVERIDHSKAGKKVIEALADAGAFDFTGWTRDELRTSVVPMFEVASKEKQDKAVGVMSLFSLMGEDQSKQFEQPPKIKQPSTTMELLKKEKELLGFYLTGHPMDAYQSILKQLSCIPLGDIDELPHDAIFRCSLIIESVGLRISAKTQRKFAILIVSDGHTSHELPVWADLYDSHKHLIVENQLIYAVLQIDKKEESPKLNCRWLGDLTLADEAMIQAADQAYDAAKQKSARMASAQKREAKKPKVEVKEVEPEKTHVHMKLNAAETRLSHILELRSIFEEHRGTTPLTIDFNISDKTIGSLQITARWGVKVTKEFLQKVESKPFVLKISQ